MNFFSVFFSILSYSFSKFFFFLFLNLVIFDDLVIKHDDLLNKIIFDYTFSTFTLSIVNKASFSTNQKSKLNPMVEKVSSTKLENKFKIEKKKSEGEEY